MTHQTGIHGERRPPSARVPPAHPGGCPRCPAPAPAGAAAPRPRHPHPRGRAPRIPGPAAAGCGRCRDSGSSGRDKVKLPEGAGRFPAISGG